jgi:hypothetical protein
MQGLPSIFSRNYFLEGTRFEEIMGRGCGWQGRSAKKAEKSDGCPGRHLSIDNLVFFWQKANWIEIAKIMLKLINKFS